MVFSIGLLLSLVLLTFLSGRATRRLSESQPRGRFLLLALFYVVFYLVTLDYMAGGNYIIHRLQLLALLSFIFWVASSTELARFRVLVSCLSALIVVSSIAYYTLTYWKYGKHIASELSLAEHIVEGSTIMPVVLTSLPDDEEKLFSYQPFPNVLLHAEGHFVRLRRVVDLGNYQGTKVYFPLRFRQQFDPWLHIAIDGKLERKKDRGPSLNLAGHDDGRVFVDYIVIVG